MDRVPKMAIGAQAYLPGAKISQQIVLRTLQKRESSVIVF
jgi:hypothetical protein